MNLKKLILIAIFLKYLIPTWQWNDKWIANLIMTFNTMAMNQEVIWFLSEQMNTKQTENLTEFIKRIDEATGLTQFVWTNRTDVRMVQIVSKRNAMALVFTTGANDPVMYKHNRIMTGRHFGLSIVVYVSKVSEIKTIEDLCYVMYQGSFVNSLIYFQTIEGYNNLFGYEQYPVFKPDNRTDLQAFIQRQYKKVLTATQDVGGYKFHTPLRQDLPRIFKYNDKYGREQLQGTTYRILESFIESLNGTMVEYEMKKDNAGGEAVNMKEILDLVRSSKIDISAHAYAFFKSDDDLDRSYPIMVVKWCLMVPLRNSISTFYYPLQPFEWTVWFVVLSVLLSLSLIDFVVILWITSVRGTRHKLFSLLCKALLDDFCYVINVAAANTIRITSWIRFILYATIFFFGFFLSANYTSYLGSFLTVTLFRAQINSIDDLVKAQLPVMVIDYELEFLLSEGYVPSKGFQDLLRPVDPATFQIHQLKFNTSYAYFVTDEQWHFFDESQRHLKQRIFQFSDICFGSYYLAYPMQTDSAIWRDLEYFLFSMHSTGLFQMYENSAFRYAVTAGYIRRFGETEEHTSAGLEHLNMIFLILICTYLLGGLCLIFEILFFQYFKKKSCKRNERKIVKY